MSGIFISLEGGEGMGKSTQARLLCDRLAEEQIPYVATREPGGTAGAEAIRKLLLHPEGEGWGARAEAALFAAARSDHVERLIRPALEAGQWVVCDRFVDSSRAYQGIAGELGDDAIRALHTIGSGGLMPDVTILLTAGSHHVSKRLRARDGDDQDAIGGRSDEYHAAVNQAFRSLAQQEPDRFIEVDGEGTPAQVHQRILNHLKPYLSGDCP